MCALFERLEVKIPVEHRAAPPVVEVRIRNEQALGVAMDKWAVLTAEPLDGSNTQGIEVYTSSRRRLAVRAVTLLPDSPVALLRLADPAKGDDVAKTEYYRGDCAALDQEQTVELFGFDEAGRLASQRLPSRFTACQRPGKLVVVDVEPAALQVPQGAPLFTEDGRLVALKVESEAQQLVARETRTRECVIDALFYEFAAMWE